MRNRKKLIFNFIIYLSILFCSQTCDIAAFTAPSLKHKLTQPNFEESFYRTQVLRKLEINSEHLNYLNTMVQNEVRGFLGYHGDSIDYFIYQDIIRLIIEEIVGIPIRENFHFLAPPLDPILKIQTKEQLIKVFESQKNCIPILYEATFPLNFTLWGNLDRLGLSPLENYIKNESVKPLGYQKRLKWFFNNLGIQEKNIATLFETGRKKLMTNKGVIVQIFDESKSSYELAKKMAYPSYPNGFISENKTVDDYYMNDFIILPYPHEIRLLLSNEKILNPTNQLKIIRYVPEIKASDLLSYQKSLRKKIKVLSYNKVKKNNYENQLKTVWKLN